MSTPPEGALEIYWRRCVAIVVAAGSALFVVVAILLLVQGGGVLGDAVVALCGVVAGVFALAGATRLRDETRPILVFDCDGIRDLTGVFMLGHIEWANVSEVRTGLTTRVALTPGTRAPLGIARRSLLFVRSGSGPSSIRFTTHATTAPRHLGARLRTIAPQSVPIT